MNNTKITPSRSAAIDEAERVGFAETGHATYRCAECAFVGSAEQLAGHYRVTRCSPDVRVIR